MEGASPWGPAALAASRIAAGASFFPLYAGAAYGVFRTPGAAFAAFTSSGWLFVSSFLVAVVLLIVDRRDPYDARGRSVTCLGGAVIGIVAQIALAIVGLGALGISR